MNAITAIARQFLVQRVKKRPGLPSVSFRRPATREEDRRGEGRASPAEKLAQALEMIESMLMAWLAQDG